MNELQICPCENLESEDAREEMLNISGFIQSFEKGKQNIAKGKVTPCENLKRKYIDKSRE